MVKNLVGLGWAALGAVAHPIVACCLVESNCRSATIPIRREFAPQRHGHIHDMMVRFHPSSKEFTMSNAARPQVAQDTHVEIELINEQGDGERMEFDLVADSAADFANGRIGVGTPL